MLTYFKLDEAVRFIEKLYPGYWKGIVYIDVLHLRRNPDGKQSSRLVHRIPLSSADDLAGQPQASLDEMTRQGYHFFFTCSWFDVSGKRKKVNAVGVPFLWADVDDINETEMMIRLQKCPLHPTAVVSTGGGYHLYWALKEWVDYKETDPSYVEAALRKLHNWVGGDHTHDITRLLRLPGTWNNKPWKYPDPMECKLQAWHNEFKYTLEQIIMQPIALSEIRLPADFIEKYILNGEPISEGGDRSSRDFAVMKELIKAQHTRQEIKQIFERAEWGISSKQREKGEAYFNYTYDAAVTEVGDTQSSIFDDGKCVYKNSLKGNGMVFREAISNFAMIPRAYVEVVDFEGSSMEVDVVCGKRHKTKIMLSAKDLNSFHRLVEAVNIPGMAWMGSQTDYQHYITYLASKGVQDYKATYVVGWHKESFVLPTETWFGEDIQYIRYGATPHITCVREEIDFNIFMPRLHDHTVMLHEISVSLPVLGWFLAAAHAVAVRDRYFQQFPILCLHGLPGSGKTTLGRLFNSLIFGVESDYSIETSLAVFRRAFMSTNTFPILIDEYEHAKTPKILSLNALLRVAYQAGGAQHFEKTTDQVLDLKMQAPIVITTPSGIEDGALQERALHVRLQPFDRKRGRDGMTWFRDNSTGGFLYNWLQVNPTPWVEDVRKFRDLIDAPDRQQHCFAVVSAVLHYLDENFWGGIYGLDGIVSLWKTQCNRIEDVSIHSSIDVLLSYLVRERVLLKGAHWWIDTTGTLCIHQAKFLDAALEHSYKLGLPLTLSRTMLLSALKDMQKTGTVLGVNIVRHCPSDKQKKSCLILAVEKFPQTFQESV